VVKSDFYEVITVSVMKNDPGVKEEGRSEQTPRVAFAGLPGHRCPGGGKKVLTRIIPM
jgi:hypothetical protein